LAFAQSDGQLGQVSGDARRQAVSLRPLDVWPGQIPDCHSDSRSQSLWGNVPEIVTLKGEDQIDSGVAIEPARAVPDARPVRVGVMPAGQTQPVAETSGL